ncbi:phosphatidylserine decarboxylase [Clostridium felsineum]|uniref:phosphatidylserine decarboxylase n=1 Tax=Clostridium felsineum TaxID=36839 RepID=UPI00214D55C8|nr:phosphatidylserine decarboxylase [Clostridium felsineum]MCR3758874.1 phosphatidylserine decarboxylase [Clostridium felsineum]
MIKFYNRKTKQYEIEKVAGENYLNWTYSSPIGMGFLEAIIKKKAFSSIYGSFCDSKMSRSKVRTFIKNFDIDMQECTEKQEEFKCFNDFFTRKLTEKARPINKDNNIFISPGDGRLLAYENIDLDNLVEIKGMSYSLKELINDEKVSSKYENATCLILRLCPTDYHRFHFVDSGVCSATSKIKGAYYSVNPIALNKVKKLFCANKREWSILKSHNFKDVLYVEVGATCVGAIIQTYKENTKISKGDEKGYFKFGGSTVVLFLEKDAVKIDSDILEQTKLGYETKVIMGEKIGIK